jgi:hypothetical protein
MIVAIVKAAAAIAAIHTEYASHGAHRATDAGSHRAANDLTYRTGNPAAFAGAFFRAPYQALGMADVRDREQGKRHRRRRKMKFEGHAGRQRRCPDPGLHLNSLMLGHYGTGGAGTSNADPTEWLQQPGEYISWRRRRVTRTARASI